MKRPLLGRISLLTVCGLALAATALAADVEHGKSVYASRCAFCHGANGNGDGPAGAALKPPPTNFTDPGYWTAAKPEAIKAAIENGKPATAMMPFKSALGPADIDDVSAYLRTFAPHP